MSALSARSFHGLAPHGAPLRFGSLGDREDGSVQWLLRRNCSMTPRQLVVFYLSLCALSACHRRRLLAARRDAGDAVRQLEMLAVGAALLRVCAACRRPRADALPPGRLTVECTLGRHIEHVEFVPAWVRVEPAHGDRSLIELSGQGQRIAVGRFVRPELRRPLADELRARCAVDGAAP